MAPHSPPRLELRFLGQVQAARDSVPLSGKLYGKLFALLAYLVVESERRHSRETLAYMLWPALSADAARTNLRQTLYYLRRALGDPSFLHADRETIGIVPESSHWLDVQAFQEPSRPCSRCALDERLAPCAACLDAMAQRMSLYRGDFLAGLVVDAAPEFEEWREGKRALLHREALALLERLRLGQELRGELEQALLYARRYTELEPWDDEGQRQLMRLLAENGQRAAALAQYEHFRTIIARELGLEPEPSTHTLAEHIRQGMFAAAAEAQTWEPAAPVNERRLATILCCRLDVPCPDDPDEIASRLREPHRLCTQIIGRHSGYIAQTHGGMILAYFGFPVAFEDTAQRAVNAALALIEEVNTLVPLRVGVHTGIIVSGDAPLLPDTAGVTSDVALRLCDSASAGEVLVSDTTQRLVQGFFSLQPVRRQALAGYPHNNARMYRVRGRTGAINRLDAVARLSPLVGRRAELARLLNCWQAAKQGRGHLVLIRGEAGIGKSRLIRALRDIVSKEPCIVRELHCFPEYAHTPLHPVVVWLETVFRVSPNDPPAVRHDKIVAYLAEHYPEAPAEVTPVLASLLGATSAQAGQDHQPHQKERTFSVLLDLLEGLAARLPLLLIIEDVHWIDPSTHELLERHAQQPIAAPILAVYSARPELEPAGLDKDSILDLASLDDADVARLVESAGASLAPDAVRRIVARAEGVPLFAEEMALMAKEASSNDTEMPATLHYLLLARLDALKQARRVAQLAATIGREFDRELLEQIAGPEDATLDAALQAMQQARLIMATTVSGTRFQFRHALIQTAAYSSQTKADRQTTHRNIAEALSIRFPQRAAQRPEQVARHFTAADAPAEAIAWWLAAGRRALSACANAEARDHLRSGLALIERLPAGDERDAMECALLQVFGQTLRALHGSDSAEAAQVDERVLALSRSQA